MTLPPPFLPGSRHVHVVVETPAGSRWKYEWSSEHQALKAKRMLSMGLAFPFDFGFVPGTSADDGDPIDVVLVSEAPSAPLALVDARVLGVVKVRQTSDGPMRRNDRIVAVPLPSIRYARARQLADLGVPLLAELEAFLRDYVERAGRRFQGLGRGGRREALALIDRARQ